MISFCPNCNSYDFMECEYGYGAAVPCRIYHGSKVIGMVTDNEDSEKIYRIDSDIFGIHKPLCSSYLNALYEAKEIFSILIKMIKS